MQGNLHYLLSTSYVLSISLFVIICPLNSVCKIKEVTGGSEGVLI